MTSTRSAVECVQAAQPQWTSIETAASVLGLTGHELLHAGPPLHDPCNPPRVLLSSAAVTIVHEGWAADLDAAEALVRDGEVTLMPAQPRGCVVPLAFVVAPSTPLCVVDDASGTAAPRHAPLSTLRGFDTRMGNRDAGLPARLAQRDATLVPALQRLLDAHGPWPLLPFAAEGLRAGDDLHSRTTAANLALAGHLRSIGAASLADDLEASPLFFLTLWMAACALMLGAAEGDGASSLVTRAGGNGERFGIALAAAPDRWVCVDAEAPQGALVATAKGAVGISAAIGDSAVIDMLGFGGQRLAHAPEPRRAFAGFLPESLDGIAEKLLVAPHPAIDPAWPVGLDAQRVVNQQQAPFVALAMLANDGRGGFAGRGIYRPPVTLFEQALAASAPSSSAPSSSAAPAVPAAPARSA